MCFGKTLSNLHKHLTGLLVQDQTVTNKRPKLKTFSSAGFYDSFYGVFAQRKWIVCEQRNVA